MRRWTWVWMCLVLFGLPVASALAEPSSDATNDSAARPNILLCMADDWGWPHAGAYGDPVVKTPNFDRLAREGVLFNHAYVTSPSCTPSRGSVLTGQWHWRLEAGVNLHGRFPDKFPSYPERLAKAGYAVGHSSKAWGPGRMATPGREFAGKRYRNFQAFLKQRPSDQPFCYWLGSTDPHRAYERGTGKASGMQLDKIKLHACLPDAEEVRGDVADYYFEVQRFDSLVGEALAALEEAGELDRTIVVMTGDHGMPFPRCKANLYDSGTRVPLAIRWPNGAASGQVVDAFVSLSDLAPTFFELAGEPIPPETTGRSLVALIGNDDAARRDAAAAREHVLFGKERHVPCQEAPDRGGYPCRGIRTADFLYIRNFTPERWPVGTPHAELAFIKGRALGDCDNGPTKTYMVENRDTDDEHRRLYDLAFAKRPAEELYDLRTDPDQLKSVAGEAKYADVQRELSEQLLSELKATGDLRALGRGEEYEQYEYLGPK